MKITKKVISAVWLVLVLAFIYVPILLLAVYSVTDATMVGGPVGGFSFQNYLTLFKNEDLRGMIGGTILLAVGAALISAVLGTIGAIGSFYSKRTAKHLITIFIFTCFKNTCIFRNTSAVFSPPRSIQISCADVTFRICLKPIPAALFARQVP